MKGENLPYEIPLRGNFAKSKIISQGKQKHKIRESFRLRIKKYSIYQTPLVLLFAVALAFPYVCEAGDSPIISAVQIKGINSNDDFIEIYNPGCDSVDISNWKLRKRISSGTESSIKVLSDNTVLHAKGYFLWSNSGLADAIGADQSTGATLSENYSIAMLDDEKIVDSITWGNNVHSFAGSFLYSQNPTALQALRRNVDNEFEIESNYHPKNSTFTNDDELAQCLKEEPDLPFEPKIYSDKILITELFPNPFQAKYEEYVELYNGTLADVDLEGWKLHDASKTGQYTFPAGVIIKAKKYLAIFKKDFKFALNNSGNESVTLFDPNGKEISKVAYDSSKRNVSYNFNGDNWHWSKFLTPGEENIFNNEPYGTLKIDDNVFVNVYADFLISTGDKDGDSVKVSWDFGDGHKSYLAKTKHKYENAGIYNGTVKLSDGSEDVMKNFIVEVKKFPHPKVKIISIKANPKGSDVLGESLVIENKSKKKIDLKGWSIATGTKKLSNHPITEKFVLKKKQTKEITREFSKFSLNNKKGKIELRYPDGKVADKIKYDHGKISITDDEVYAKVDGKWNWIPSAQSQKPIKSIKQDAVINSSLVTENAALIVPIKVEREIESLLLAPEDVVQIELLKKQARVLGVESLRELDGQYFFTPQNVEQEHYAIKFLKNISTELNLKLNMLLNFFK